LNADYRPSRKEGPALSFIPAGYYNAIMVFDYAPGVLFRIYTAPLRFTAIQLQPGEKVLGKVVIVAAASGKMLRFPIDEVAERTQPPFVA
jgi:type IV secretory pathway VirB9-like protein